MMRCQRVLRAGSLGFFKRTTHWLPHPAKEETGGEDAFLATNHALGVLDGVSWWAQAHKRFASAGLVSDLLARSAYEIVNDEWWDEPQRGPDVAFRLLTHAYENIQKDIAAGEAYLVDALGEKVSPSARANDPSPLVVGTTTALFATIADDGSLSIANLGDCTAVVLRRGNIVLETKPQHHNFSTPFQLGTASKDRPEMADKYALMLEPKDLVIIGSDGVFDNVFLTDAVATVNQRMAEVALRGVLDIPIASLHQPSKYHQNRQEELKLLATLAALNRRPLSELSADDRDLMAMNVAALQILHAASVNAEDPRSNTPYAQACLEEGAYFEGGKMDDMTLIIAMVGENEMFSGERTGKGSVIGVSLPHKNWP